MSGFDVERFDGLLRESLHQAAVDGLPEDELVTRLRQHANSIERHGLGAHAGVTGIPVVLEDYRLELNRDADADRERAPEPTP